MADMNYMAGAYKEALAHWKKIIKKQLPDPPKDPKTTDRQTPAAALPFFLLKDYMDDSTPKDNR